MPPDTGKWDRVLKIVFPVIALIVPVSAVYLVYFQLRTPAIDSPATSLAQQHWPDVASAVIVSLTFSGVGTFVVWRRFLQIQARLFFLMVQPIALGLLFFLPFPNLADRPYWMQVISSAGFHISGSLLVHYYMTFPVKLGSPRQRRRALALVYGLMPVALACRLSSTDLGLRLTFLYNTLEITGAIGLLIYAYLRRATPDGQRRLRVIVFGTVISGIPGFVFYLIPTIAGEPHRMPDWMVGPIMLVAPLAYVVAILRHDLFNIDRVLNRALVYAIIAFGILVLYLGPFLLIYQLLPNDWLAQVFVSAGLTLLIGLGFDWTRVRVQHWVDRLFYGGWYDYPGVVETISDALARSIERAELTDVLTRQVPSLMQLEPGVLYIGDARPVAPPTSPPLAQFPLYFQGQSRGEWIVGRRRDGEDFSPGDRRILNTIARQAEVCLGNVLLVEMLRQQLDEIRANQETLARAQRQLLRSREEERARLARDLHDGPIQDLVGLNMQLGLVLANGDAPVNQSLTGMRAEVRALLGALRQTCAELRPPMLDTIGLGAALRVLANDWASQSGVALTLDLPPDATLRALPGEIAVNLYRLVQEALANIARHAAANTACIQLRRQDSRFVLSIHDDGCGFAVPATFHDLAAQGHFGLVGMQERAALIGAQWSVESSPGHGTTVRIFVP